MAKNGPQTIYDRDFSVRKETRAPCVAQAYANIQRDAQIEFLAISTNVTDNFDVFMGTKYSQVKYKQQTNK